MHAVAVPEIRRGGSTCAISKARTQTHLGYELVS